jgi:leader peptidase (prepilin peptidase)/N-methyltransferase
MTLALAWHFDVSLALLGALAFTWSLIALTMIDMDHQLLPDDITLPLLWLGLLFNLSATYVSLPDAVIGAMMGYLSLWSLYWIFKLITGKEGMGYGDFKLLAALGAWMGWQALPMIILLSSVVGAVCGIALMVIKRRGKDIPIPFGPYLAAAGWIVLLWGDTLMSRYSIALGAG